MGKKRFCMPDPAAAVTDELLMSYIEPGSRVIDLGCGDGRLLCRLRDEHDCSVQGVELDLEGISASLANGVAVIRADLDEGLAGIPDDAFDCAVLSQTLQQVRFPKKVLSAIQRISQRSLIVVPNFGYWKIRYQVMWNGRAPVTEALPYEWYNTPNLHFMSMHDFRDVATHLHFRIRQELPLIGGRARDGAWLPNLRAESLLYVLERDGSGSLPTA